MQIDAFPGAGRLLSDYLNVPIGREGVRCTYWTGWDSKLGRRVYGPYSGKGTPSQIARAALSAFHRAKLSPKSLSVREVRRFMKRNNIGVDCSGFVYHLADAINHDRGGRGIKSNFAEFGKFLPSWRLSWRVNADHLTDAAHSSAVGLQAVEVGDLIRLSRGKHVMIVVDVGPKHITYAHSSALLAKKSGVHLGRIEIVDRTKPLKEQKWEEESWNGKNLSLFLHPESGDGLRRLT